MKQLFISPRVFLAVLVIAFSAVASYGQISAFSFQGRLNDGTNPANGHYDLQFRLYNAAVGGNQLGPLLAVSGVTLINGVFSVPLDFGPSVTFDSPNVYIEIGVHPAGSPNPFTILGPRQQLTVAPLAVRARTASTADLAGESLHAAVAEVAHNADNATNAASLDGLPSSSYAKLNVVNTGDLRTTGALAITSNAFQSVSANGFVKAMLYVQQNGTILRCFNGITNSPTGTCGFTINHAGGTGVYHIIFDFRVDDRFLTVTARNPDVVSTFVSASFQFVPGNPNATDVITFITNAGTLGGDEANFMLIVY